MPKRKTTDYRLPACRQAGQTTEKKKDEAKTAVVGSRWTVDQKGFTLVELMVVISIIAILSAIGLTVYTQAQRAGRDSKRQQDLSEIQKALEQFYAVNRFYPGSNGHTTAAESFPTAVGSYFSSGVIPDDPKNVAPNVYTYRACSGADKFVLCASLESCPGNNCNASAIPAVDTGCGAFTSGNLFYCVASLSN